MRKQIIPLTQAAYNEGRSTTELVLALRLLAEKAITSSNYEIHLLMLDMSKAFDTIQRGTLFEDLKGTLWKWWTPSYPPSVRWCTNISKTRKRNR